MNELPEIKLLHGFCAMPFGAGKERATELFGKPDEIQNLKEDLLNSHSLVYHYWDFGFSLFFNSGDQPAFCSAEVDNRETLLFEKKIFLLREKEIISLLKENGFQLSNTEEHNWGEKRISFDEAGLDCYFENNKLVAVNFGMAPLENKFYFFPN